MVLSFSGSWQALQSGCMVLSFSGSWQALHSAHSGFVSASSALSHTPEGHAQSHSGFTSLTLSVPHEHEQPSSAVCPPKEAAHKPAALISEHPEISRPYIALAAAIAAASSSKQLGISSSTKP